MIYASSSIIVNTEKDTLWANIVDACTHSDKYSDEIINLIIEDNYYDGLLRSYEIDTYQIKERVFFLKEKNMAVLRLSEHPLYFGETIIHILCSDDERLSDKKVTLNAIVAWRIHPGIVAAPHITKQDFLDHFVKNIANASEHSAFAAILG